MLKLPLPVILPKLPFLFIGRGNFSGLEPYGKIDLARILPKPVLDMERTLAEGYTVEITINLKEHEPHEEEEVEEEPKEGTDPEREEESESEPEPEIEDPMVRIWLRELGEHSDEERGEARAETDGMRHFTKPKQWPTTLDIQRGIKLSPKWSCRRSSLSPRPCIMLSSYVSFPPWAT